jgi:hypothetical protein
VCVNCSEPGFQYGSQILAQWSALRTISLNKSKLIAQADPLDLAALIEPTCYFVHVRQPNPFVHLSSSVESRFPIGFDFGGCLLRSRRYCRHWEPLFFGFCLAPLAPRLWNMETASSQTDYSCASASIVESN